MSKFYQRAMMMLVVLIFLSGCQTRIPEKSVSLEEARKISANLSSGNFKAPPRTIKNLLNLMGYRGQKISKCSVETDTLSLKQIEEQLNLLSREKRYTQSRTAQSMARSEFESGKAGKAARIQRLSIDYLPSYSTAVHGSVLAQLALYLATAGRFEEAESALSEAKGYLASWNLKRSRIGNKAKYWVAPGYLEAVAQAEIAKSKGDLFAAEFYNRKAMKVLKDAEKLGFSAKGWEMRDQKEMVQSALTDVILSQGRTIEAESIAREALQSSSAGTIESIIAEQLSRILLIQGRAGDAETMARATLWKYSLELTYCSSLNYNKARIALANALGAQGKWSEALEVFNAVKDGLKNDVETFNAFFANNIDWSIALLHTGQAGEAKLKLLKAIPQSADRYGSDHYKTAELKGLLAVTHLASGERLSALKVFSETLPVLLDRMSTAGGESVSVQVRNNRLGLILETYLDLLREMRGTPLERQAGINAAAEGFRIADVLRSRTVQGALTESGARASAGNPQLADLIRREQDAKKQITTLQKTLSNLVSQSKEYRDEKSIGLARKKIELLGLARKALLKEVGNKFPNYAELINPKPLSLEQARTHMLLGEALVSFYVGDKKTSIWVVPKSGDISFATVDLGRDQLGALVSSLRKALDPGSVATLGDIPAFDVAGAYDLYTKLLKPVEAGWKTAKSLLIVADGALGQLPFSLLPTKPAAMTKDNRLLFKGYRTIPWLARTHSVTVLPSVTSMKALRGTRVTQKGQRPFLGFGDPFFNKSQQLAAKDQTQSVQLASRGVALRSVPKTRSVDSAEIERLPRLPDTRTEIEQIARVMKADPMKDIYLGERATEETVKKLDLTPYKVISFATHGLIPGDLNGLNQPALALSSPKVTGGKGDGLLTMDEILGLRLNADWAVLSACNTAAADGKGAEAISGLGRAFFYAGARALLVSNWPVHSGATADLMTDLFQRQASNSNISRAEALRLTRLQLIDKGTGKVSGKATFSYAHPIFWAPFTLVGDGGGSKTGS